LARIGNIIVKDEDISRIKLELITFFKQNPGTVDSAENISVRLGRSKDEVEEALEQMAKHDICYKISSRPQPIYMYQPTAQILKRIAELAPDMDYSTQLELVNALLTRGRAT